MIHAYFYKNPLATDDKRLEPKQLRITSRLRPLALPRLPPFGLHALLVSILL